MGVARQPLPRGCLCLESKTTSAARMLSALLPKAPINPTDSFHLYPCLFIVLPRDQSRVFHTGVATLSYEFKRNLDASAHPCRDRQAHSVTPDHCFYENSFLFFSFVLPLSSCAFLALAIRLYCLAVFSFASKLPSWLLHPLGNLFLYQDLILLHHQVPIFPHRVGVYRRLVEFSLSSKATCVLLWQLFRQFSPLLLHVLFLSCRPSHAMFANA